MKILAIETSCDETAVCVLDANGTADDASYTVLGNALYSQVEKHAPFGGVYPSLAKREHAANLTPLLAQCLIDAKLAAPSSTPLSNNTISFISDVLTRELDTAEMLVTYLNTIARPDIDAIAVTHGPGLEPALWVGINVARALAHTWGLPIIPVNHLEGHFAASAVTQEDADTHMYRMQSIQFPALGLLISGGHTEFVHIEKWGTYSVVGGTRDDSVGEAFDKVARMLGLPYPGGPEISRLAERGRPTLLQHKTPPVPHLHPLPRPMLHSDDLDVSFSGLKTAVKYMLRDIGDPSDEVRAYIAADFEESVTDVLCSKTNQALEKYPTRTFMLGGGVASNTYIRTKLTALFSQRDESIPLLLPAPGLSTDNAIMIGMAGYLRHLRNTPTRTAQDDLRADGNLSINSTRLSSSPIHT